MELWERMDFLVMAARTDLLKNKETYGRAYGLLSEERKSKADRMAMQADKERSAAAGLLLNYCLRKWRQRYCVQAEHSDAAKAGIVKVEIAKAGVAKAGIAKAEVVGAESGFAAYNPVMVDIGEAISGYDRSVDPKILLKNGGKPVFAERPFGEKELWFSISHAGSYAVCALCDNAIGVDIEGEREVSEAMGKRIFSEEEWNWIRWGSKSGMQECEWRTQAAQSRFFRLWTLKEAYGKMTGEGIARSLKNLHFSAAAGERQMYAEAPEEAVFFTYEIGMYCLSVAIKK